MLLRLRLCRSARRTGDGDEYFDLRICRGIFPSGPAGFDFPMKVDAEIGNYKNFT